MTKLEKLRLESQSIKLGTAIIEMSKKHKKIGVFSVQTDSDYILWTKSMFFLRKINDSFLDVSWKNDNKNPLDYDAILLINFKFKSRLNEIKFEKTTSNLVGFSGFLPVIKINYCLTSNEFSFERDCNYVDDGVSAAMFKMGLRKRVQDK